MKYQKLCLAMIAGLLHFTSQAQKIDRKALVERHTIINTQADSLGSLSVGNGRFAFTVDITGLQTFPEYYAKGVPLGTQSEWGWHSFIDTVGYKFEESLKTYNINGRPISYSVQVNTPKRNKEASDWFRQNAHRLQLSNLGFEIIKKDCSIAAISDIKNIHQELNMWRGEIVSNFTVEGVPVKVLTYCHQQKDVIAVKVSSPLLSEGRLKIRLKFPFPTNEFADMGVDYHHPEKHRSEIEYTDNHNANVIHQLDSEVYETHFKWDDKAIMQKGKASHEFILSPGKEATTFQFSCMFKQRYPIKKLLIEPGFSETQSNSIAEWPKFWMRGGAVDLSGSKDKRAGELERRIVTSQYLTKIQCSGNYPPQETGLTYNSWYGKPHLEMHWWHGIHFALWGRPDLLENSMRWYSGRVEERAKGIAQRQGFKGARWQKMTDPDGNESPSSVGAFLIWQQPHFIYFAELDYRAHPTLETLRKYKEQVFATAEFMASYAYFDKAKGRYVLGPGMIPSQEVHNQATTFNPPYELTYWHWALNVAQQWRERLKMGRDKQWDDVINKLSPLPQKDGVYLEAESAPDSYTNPKDITDHPSTLAAYGMLPYTPMMDTTVMRNTLNLIWKVWDWPKTWGWDFPMTAMTATRLNMPEKAIDALFMPIMTNTYLSNGHNYQDKRLTLYLPGNGGLLAAVAMMCAGWDGCQVKNPGFPKNGQWKVKWEGLQKMP
ncbi:hypothetical protein BEL04_16865 [Mucilaginibacter sp. PPCGB 2223]|uniref:hypothetical protein n=1 Tax=Mucilaginibacter sp. PPCGB 2223 TaxID=1886027 RepID=UPI000824434D|nr:hypothetical protein [Mucilaginibacter sp. PPCGB 2223]OCX51688.1 hypothetical protein BEL04_16865 [Mucilaginibacter sp. PPCGB 2223]